VGDVSFSLNSATGDLIWDSPKQQGEFNIAILIEEWRNGIRIGSVLRDMQIIIVACNNSPPVIDPIADTCIEAGKYLRFPVTARDSAGDKITLTATGGPFILSESPAIIDPDPAVANGVVQTLFKWNTVCNHVKINPYQVFFKAKDDAKPVSLVSFRSVRILVIGPAPKNLTATPIGNTITLSWDNYTCPNASGYDIYRKADSTGYIPGYCETGVPSYLGYAVVARINNVTQTSYLDDNNGAGLTRGLKYCYLVVARYPDKAESYASNEACATLKKDLAVITNASINTTSETEGSVYVAWSKPTEIDPVQIPGPYKYIIARSRSDAPGQFVLVDSLNNLNDTVFTDNLLNTRDYSYQYRIDFYNVTPGNRFPVGSSQVASTLYLTATPTDKMNRLTWSNDVPWLNHLFIVYRKDPGGTAFDSIGQSAVPAYNDRKLTNGLSYCYLIKSVGKYSASGFVEPIINFSQETCGIPVDNVPPCPPMLSVETVCDVSSNRLQWAIPADTCDRDIAGYRILFIQGYGTPVLIDSIMSPGDTSYLHTPYQSIAGCYAVIAVDSSGNASDTSNIYCVDYTACPAYRLPNVFTPNGDGKNDLFIPFPGYTSVAGVDLKIYDRWGRLVFDTDDPAINWDGKDKTTGQPCSDGVYFYVCDVKEITLNGLVNRNIHGSVTILR
jgi:gliding motility-associated-like protein